MTGTGDDAELVAATLAGDQRAFARLVAAHRVPLMAHLRRMVGPVAADDVAQETLLRVWRNLERFDPARAFRPWLLVIATREAFRHLRTQAPHRLPTLLECDLDGSRDGPPDERVIAHETGRDRAAALEAALDALPPKARALYELRYRQELPVADIAEHLGVTTNALKVRLHRLRRRLADLMEEAGDEP